MKVRCIKVPVPFVGAQLETSPWVTVGREYLVAAMSANTTGDISLQILDNTDELGWFDADCFVTTDPTIPANWRVELQEGGNLDVGPPQWHVRGFWERYYDDADPEAIEIVERDLAVIRGETPE